MQIGEIQFLESIPCKATEVKIIPYEKTSKRYWVSESCGWSSVDDEVKQKGYSNGQNNFCREVKCASKHKSTWQNMTKPKVTAWHDTTWHDKKVTPPQLFKIKHKNAKRLSKHFQKSVFEEVLSLQKSRVHQNKTKHESTWQNMTKPKVTAWHDMTWHDKKVTPPQLFKIKHKNAKRLSKHFQKSVFEEVLSLQKSRVHQNKTKHESTWQNMTKPKVTAWHDMTWQKWRLCNYSR